MDPIQPTTQPIPSPIPSTGVPTTPELSQEEMKKNLKDLMEKIDSKYKGIKKEVPPTGSAVSPENVPPVNMNIQNETVSQNT